MSRTFSNPTQSSSWRDIPQAVKPRAMSPGGRRRVLRRMLKTVLVAGSIAAVLGLGWAFLQELQTQPGSLASKVGASPVRDIAVATDGVLDQTWITRTLALPPAATLMELDLERLRERLLASGQVQMASLARRFPATLAVTLVERTPVARVKAQLRDGALLELLVARDGVVYEGAGYDSAIIGSLVWLDGVKLRRSGNGFLPIPGMEPAADLLAKARNEAPHLYETWKVVSLARLESDREIVVNATTVGQITFSATEDFFRQLAQLDVLIDTISPLREVNLAVGLQVPVALAAAADPTVAAPVPAAAPFPTFNPTPRQSPREF